MEFDLNSHLKNRSIVLTICTLSYVGWVGCAPSSAPLVPDTTDSSAVGTADAPTADSAAEHAHIAGAHGGLIFPIGTDSYHVEAVVEKSGSLRLLLLGKDESRVQEVEIQSIQAFVRGAGETDATPIDLVATPQAGDAEGKTSQFVGQLPEGAVGKAIDVTIPNLKIDGDRFRVGFSTVLAEHASGMPPGEPSEEERQLYSSPGGAYTAADIEANGKMTASQKFKGIMSTHDMLPKAGDRICPVTLTKANPKFTWVVAGRSYQFCCPPCVDEFVRLAKENPGELQEPEAYVK